MTGWTLPTTVEVGGHVHPVNADFRDVLEILTYLNDREELERTRISVALALFYEDYESICPADFPEALRVLFWFLNGGADETDTVPSPKRIDWEQDCALIVADVNRVAGCEVRALKFCHWWTFLAWFRGIGEGQLSAVVSIREKRRKGQKLDEWEREFYQENREQIDFRVKYTAEDLAEQERLKALLGESG